MAPTTQATVTIQPARRGSKATIVHAFEKRRDEWHAACRNEDLTTALNSKGFIRMEQLEPEGYVGCDLCKAALKNQGVDWKKLRTPRDALVTETTTPPAPAPVDGNCKTCGLGTMLDANDVRLHVHPDGAKTVKGRGGCKRPAMRAPPRFVDDPPAKLAAMPATDTKYDGDAADKVVRDPAMDQEAAEALSRPDPDDEICDSCGCLTTDGCTCDSPAAENAGPRGGDGTDATPSASTGHDATPSPVAAEPAPIPAMRVMDMLDDRRDLVDALTSEIAKLKSRLEDVTAERDGAIASYERDLAYELTTDERRTAYQVLRVVLRDRCAPNLSEAQWDWAAGAYLKLKEGAC